MSNQEHYKPKFSREQEPWDDGSWQTGSTKPPKSHSPIIALMLIVIIFLCGIITVLGILNIRLFSQLRVQKEPDYSITFTPEETEPETPVTTAPEETVPVESVQENALSIAIQESPQSPENIPQSGGLSLQEIYEKNIPSVVSLACTLRGGSSTGTGVILSDNGYILTNAHVVENARSVTVYLTDNRHFEATLVGADEITDLAVLHISAEALTPVEFGDSAILRVGDSVSAIGDPLGMEFRGSFTDGIISAINRDVSIDGRTMSLIQTNAALNSGNSGGPLINSFGQVIGINTMKIGTFTDSAGVEGLGFAIPSATVKDVVDQLIEQGYVSGRPTLGINGEDLSVFYQHYYRMPAGLYITHVQEGSQADRSGILVGDILLALDDNRINGVEDLNSFLYSHQVGDTVTAVIYRGGKQAAVELTLTEAKG